MGGNLSQTTAAWFARLDDPTHITEAEVEQLVTLGLLPWFKAPTAYSYIPGPVVDNAGVQSAASDACDVTVSVVAASTEPNPTLGLQLSISSLLATTLLPPWDLSIAWPALNQVVKAYGFESLNDLSVQGASGANLTSSGVSDVLWPNKINSVHKLVIVTAQTTNTSGLTLQVGGRPCLIQYDDSAYVR